MKKYLEDIVKNYNEKHSVRVYFNTAHAIIFEDNEEPSYVPDCAGNHDPENWLTAISENHLEQAFEVLSVVEDTSDIRDGQVDIYVRSLFGQNMSRTLTIESNNAAIRKVFAA